MIRCQAFAHFKFIETDLRIGVFSFAKSLKTKMRNKIRNRVSGRTVPQYTKREPNNNPITRRSCNAVRACSIARGHVCMTRGEVAGEG